MGIARNSVREAIKILVFMGVLEIRRPEGTFVCDGFSESMINPMIYGVILNQGDSCDSPMELREMIEVGVLRLAMEKATEKDLTQVLAALDALKTECLRQPPDFEKAFSADNAFHDEIDKICDNLIVTKINGIVRMLTNKLRYETTKKMLLTGQGERHCRAHEQIYIMLKEKNCHDRNAFIRATYFLEELGR